MGTIIIRYDNVTLIPLVLQSELQIKKIPVRHWVLQVREFCQTYQLFARPAFFLEIF